ncbi:MAG: Dihydroorotate dehydrogenase 2 [Candidatus Peregrinibacteria bacterium GW2011_GWA2_33_10]|nr:MAG: Dihydroorotate dehydrogenase 2 [Candidatus Peregrinibacteria bacterium GW2011_GWA2_33_10]KKP41063.1 MAG: dihydroorotate dehydrogenase 2, dihydroorotate dehydrogenase (fumarate) [Candidatus Peregrinibacteria bacterium GW2011_GWC2_33_13]
MYKFNFMFYLFKVRNFIEGFIYAVFLKRIFFLLDPEFIHDRMTRAGKMLGKTFLTRTLTKIAFSYQNKTYLEQEVLGIKFKNPIGLAAGFDKNAQLTAILPEVGFGFEEIGSITGEECAGNPKPRLWRLKKSGSLVIYYGLMNDGAEKISKRLKNKKFNFPIGVSVAKTNCALTADNKEGIKDYVKAFNLMKDIGDYMTINISCPNAYGGQPFTDKVSLESLMKEISKIEYDKPIFLKMSPDLNHKEIDDILEVVEKYKISGVICTNLTKDYMNPRIKDKFNFVNGGISGKVLEEKANLMISYIFKKTKGKLIIIGCGGVFTAEDAYKKIKLGANLIQMVTGMIFQGPQTISDINLGLVELLKKDGYKNISEARGKEIL